MITLPNKYQPASPVKEGHLSNNEYIYKGLTKLEYAAIQAMKGILANKTNQTAEFTAEISVKHAKALFDRLNKEQ